MKIKHQTILLLLCVVPLVHFFSSSVFAFDVSGRVVAAGGAGIQGVTLTFTRIPTGGEPPAVQTDAQGNWRQTGFQSGSSYAVTASKQNLLFQPTVLRFSGPANNLNFTVSSTFSVSGRINAGSGSGGVTLNFTRESGTGNLPASVRSASDGLWSQSGFSVGSTYRVIPTLTGLTPTPASRTFSGPASNLDFTGSYTASTPESFIASGRVIESSGAGIEGVTISFTPISGPGSARSPVETASTGSWTRTGLAEETTYRITANKSGFAFSPDFLDVSKENLGLQFTAFAGLFSALGRITDSTGKGLQGVTMNFTKISGGGSVPARVESDSSGGWSQSGFSLGTTYQVTPTKPGFSFNPTGFSITNSRTDVNFSSPTPLNFSGSGRVTGATGTGIPGVTISFTFVSGSGPLPPAVQTSSNGDWSQSGFQAGVRYRVTPSKTGLTFSPASHDFDGGKNDLHFAAN